MEKLIKEILGKDYDKLTGTIVLVVEINPEKPREAANEAKTETS